MPIEEQTLYFEGKHLNKDGKDLNFYNIQHLDTLVMATKELKWRFCIQTQTETKSSLLEYLLALT